MRDSRQFGDREALVEPQRVHDELERQFGSIERPLLLHRAAALPAPVLIAARQLVAGAPLDAIGKRALAVGAGADPEVIAELPVVAVVSALPPGLCVGRYLVLRDSRHPPAAPDRRAAWPRRCRHRAAPAAGLRIPCSAPGSAGSSSDAPGVRGGSPPRRSARACGLGLFAAARTSGRGSDCRSRRPGRRCRRSLNDVAVDRGCGPAA